MLRSVIAGVDGSAESLAAAEWAAREAVRRGRPLRLVHAWGRSPHPPASVSARTARRAEAGRVLRAAVARAERACPGLRLLETQVQGPAVTALCRLAQDADLLVLGRSGRRGVGGLLVGSVARGVIDHTRCPVVLVRAGEGAAEEGAGRPGVGERPSERGPGREVVLGIDLGDPCDEVIGFAFDAARSRGCGLRAVHGWRDPSPLVLGPGEIGLLEDPRREEAEWSGFLTALLKVWRETYPDVPVVESVRKGNVAPRLLSAARGAALLVVGHRLSGRPRTGSVTHAVMQHADCPVALVPHFRSLARIGSWGPVGPCPSRSGRGTVT
ncbi:universal stress protein [Streptomyces sp. SYP-A7185]|uniref:universal stress protein n=1 Tax=Streptomyces sp. SYP-A7185 TaxID=3040076 RepID=UPI0038F7D4A2